ncbi:trihelix transcription factor ENAP1-like [Lotus japonicus]|uniref:trihelix transcription factor ENAP1-like n=1 Tax=Lotus japonicus TaxID=34305 RepID=UPI0025896064|nr:trihelix transcription factor ENAP1-like [Lotus japonicus]
MKDDQGAGSGGGWMSGCVLLRWAHVSLSPHQIGGALLLILSCPHLTRTTTTTQYVLTLLHHHHPICPYPTPPPNSTIHTFSPHPSPPPSSMASPPHSSPPPDPPSALPLALIPIPPPPTATPTSSRRLPPPCWSPDETFALIDAYRDKWYSLGRGNLKASHWQDVADAVSHRCPEKTPAKTPIQCRHKMEKLRKRYRTEIQRARSLPISRFTSSWAHFSLMDSMEKGPSPVKPEIDSDHSPHHDDNNNDDHDQDFYGGNDGHGSSTRSLNKLYKNGFSSGGFRIRIPTGSGAAQPGPKLFGFGKVANQKFNANLNHNASNDHEARDSGKKRERDPVGEVVSAIKVLGDGFVRMEQMKMEMAKEIEMMRIETEMKRTEMILESQQRIVESFARAISENNKKKNMRVSSPQEP